MKEKGDSTLAKADDNKFKEKLDKFKLIMSETNKGVREQIETRVDEAKQDKAHRKQKLQTPLPSSALRPDSMANTKLLSQIPEDVKDLLKKVAELKDTGKNEGFRKDFHKFVQKSYGFDTSILERRGGLNEAESKDLAEKLSKLEPQQITALNAKVVELKKDQDRGPKTQSEEVKSTEKYTPIEEPGINRR